MLKTKTKRVHQTVTLDASSARKIDAFSVELGCSRHQTMRRMLRLAIQLIDVQPALLGVIRSASCEEPHRCGVEAIHPGA